MKQLEDYVDNATFISDWQAVKLKNKQKLSHIIEKDCGIEIDKNNILLTEPIKTLGETTVPVKVGFHLVTDIQVIVSALEATE